MTKQEKISYIYHGIFSYKLKEEEVFKWTAGKALSLQKKSTPKFEFKSYPFQKRKWEIAKKAAYVIGAINGIEFVGVTGSLAMNNAKPESDIDLMVICKKNTIWVMRPIVLLKLKILGIKTRKPNDSNEKDRICINVWVDTSSLSTMEDRQNAYIAHEICATTPLVNKNQTYEKWIWENKWIGDFWPNAAKKVRTNPHYERGNPIMLLLNYIFFVPQYIYMLPRITKEKVGLHMAYFHPTDWGEKVMFKLKKYGVVF